MWTPFHTAPRAPRAFVAAALIVPIVGLLAACGQPAHPGGSVGRGEGEATTAAAASSVTTGREATETGTTETGTTETGTIETGTIDTGPMAPGTTTSGGTASAGQPTPVAMPPVTQGDVTLSATMGIGFAQHPDDPGIRRRPGLVVEYLVRNAGSEPLVAHDRVAGDFGSSTLPGEIDPEHAWVFMEGEVLRVSKQGFDAVVAFFAAPVTAVREVPAGGTISGRAVVGVPVELDVPGEEFDAPRSSVETSGAGAAWQFCLHVEPRAGEAYPSVADPGVLVTPVSAPDPGELLCTESTPLVLP